MYYRVKITPVLKINLRTTHALQIKKEAKWHTISVLGRVTNFTLREKPVFLGQK